MKKLIAGFLLSVLALAGTGARADVLVLVHGYMGSAASWEYSGINAMLAANGWPRSGVLAGGALIAPSAVPTANSSYAVELPSLAPALVQADHLQALLTQVAARHPGEAMVLVGHSAGGVIARLVLARGGAPGAKALITIATPHLGTERALQAIDATDTPWPFCLVQNFFSDGAYSAVKRSRGVLLDLSPAYPGSLLHWLNAQPHPDISYHSIVTPGPAGLGDELVPAFSQDMNRVTALAGRAETHLVASGHSLNPATGAALVAILQQL
ncbi:MAG: alpha/beta fold hydrolase [Gammaproteobacteria bacterium]|nr:alpha/beta fold hydrolase [Gammaproteobacteria bacterium]